MPVLRVLQQLGQAVSTMNSSLIDAVAAAAVSSGGELAGELVVITAKSSPDARQSLAAALSKAASGLSAGSYKHVTSVVAQLAQLDPVIFGDIAVTVLEAALRWEVSVLSDIADLGGDSKAAIVATSESCRETEVAALWLIISMILAKAVEDLPQSSISSYTAESVLIAVTQDRLAECTALDLASALAAKADLKVRSPQILVWRGKVDLTEKLLRRRLPRSDKASRRSWLARFLLERRHCRLMIRFGRLSRSA
jgi:hypothetical protein